MFAFRVIGLRIRVSESITDASDRPGITNAETPRARRRRAWRSRQNVMKMFTQIMMALQWKVTAPGRASRAESLADTVAGGRKLGPVAEHQARRVPAAFIQVSVVQ